MLLPLVQDAPKVLHPYDQTAMTLFNAIKTGWLPGDLLDDLPCKYYNGSIICEVWDFRTFESKTGDIGSLPDEFPFFQKVQLKMGMENVIKDLPSISNDSWSYDDLLQAEARIIKVMQPVLHLDPTPSLSRASASPISNGIDLHIPFGRPNVKHQDEFTINKKFPNVLCGGDAPRNGNFKSPTLISTCGDSSSSCAKHTTKGTELDLHQQDFWDNDLIDHSKMEPEIDHTQDVIFAKNVIGASGTFHVEKDLRVLCLGMNSETLLRKRQGDEFDDIQPTWKPLLKRQKIEYLESSPHNQVMNKQPTVSDHDLQWKGTQLLQQPEVDKSKHQCLGDLKHPKLEASEVMNLISLTQPRMNFFINRRNISGNEVLRCHNFQEHALDATAQSYVQHVIPEAIANMQQNNFEKCIIGHDLQMASLQNYKQFDGTSTSEASKIGLSVSYLDRDLRYSCPNVQTSSILSEKRLRRNDQQTSKFLMKRPKVKRLELAPHQTNTICDQGHQQNSNMLVKQLEAAKMLHLRCAQQTHSHMEVSKEIFEDAQMAQPSTHFCLDKRDVQGEGTVKNIEHGNFYMPFIGKGKIDGLSNLDGNMSGKVQYLSFSTSHLHVENPSNTQLSNSHMEVGEVFEDVRKAQSSMRFCSNNKDIKGDRPIVGKGKKDGLGDSYYNLSDKGQHLSFLTSCLHSKNPNNSQSSHSHTEVNEEFFENVRKAQSNKHSCSDNKDGSDEGTMGNITCGNLHMSVIEKGKKDCLSKLGCNLFNKGQYLSSRNLKIPSLSIHSSLEKEKCPQNIKQLLCYHVSTMGLAHSSESSNVHSWSAVSSQANTTASPAKRDSKYYLKNTSPSMKPVENSENLENLKTSIYADSSLDAAFPAMPHLVTEPDNIVLKRFSKITNLSESMMLTYLQINSFH